MARHDPHSGFLYSNIDFLCACCLCYRYSIARDNWLSIDPVQTEDYGEYVCTARNELGVAEGVVVLERAGLSFSHSAVICLFLVV